MKPTRNKSRAFTLLEIMVAIALFSLVVAAIYSSWNAILKGSRVALDVAAAAQRTRITMRTLQDSLLCTCMFNGNAAYYPFLADADGDFASLSFVARLPKSFPRSGKFGDLDLRRLNFTVEEGPDSTRQLVLRQNSVLMDADKDEVEHPLVLARDVEKFIVEFTDPKTGDWVSEWTTTNQLPREVRITLGLGKLDQFSNKPQEVMMAVVALPSQAVRIEWQAPMNGAPGGGVGQNRNGVNSGNNGINFNPGNNGSSFNSGQGVH